MPRFNLLVKVFVDVVRNLFPRQPLYFLITTHLYYPVYDTNPVSKTTYRVCWYLSVF